MSVRHDTPTGVRRRRLARIIATVAVSAASVAAAVVVAGCGSSSVSGVLDPVAKAASVSSAAPGFKMTMSLKVNSAALPSAISGTGSGSFTPAQREGSMSLTMNLGSELASVLGSPDLTIQEVLDGTDIYMKLPSALSSKLPGGKPWMKLDLKELASSGGISGLGSLFNSPTSEDPSQLLQYLKAVSGKVTTVGTEQVAGFQTTHYRATIDFSKYPDLVPASQRAAARQAVQQLEAMTKLKSFPADVWIDAHHLVRQMTLNINEQVPNLPQTIQTQVTVQIPEYGPQPPPSIPPADQVGDASALLSGTP